MGKGRECRALRWLLLSKSTRHPLEVRMREAQVGGERHMLASIEASNCSSDQQAHTLTASVIQ